MVCLIKAEQIKKCNY